MKVAYIFHTSGTTAAFKLGRMILPQLEQGTHGAEVVGMFFMDDNAYILRKGDPIGERLAKVAKEQNIWLPFPISDELAQTSCFSCDVGEKSRIH